MFKAGLSEMAGCGVARSMTLSPRIAETLSLMLDGGSEKEIAQQLGVSRHTVHIYVKSVYRHFGVCTRAELSALVLKALLRSVMKGSWLDDPTISEALRHVSSQALATGHAANAE